MNFKKTVTILTETLWEFLHYQPWGCPADLAESLIWLHYFRWLDSHSKLLEGTEMRWHCWRQMNLNQRFQCLQQRVYPYLHSRAPMTGQLIGLILPTVPFRIPDPATLQDLLRIMDSTVPENLMTALLPLLGIEEPESDLIEEAIDMLAPRASEVIWEPVCRSGRFLAGCAQRIQQNHWRDIWSDLDSQQRFRHRQFFGRVQNRTEALLCAFNLLLVEQLNPGLDGFSLPCPLPSLIWLPAQADSQITSCQSLLAPGGRLVIWRPTSARGDRLALSRGSLEILADSPHNRVNFLKEEPAKYA